MKKNLLHIFLLFAAVTYGAATASAKVYQSVCAGDIEDGNTWGVDPKNFELHADDVLQITHDVFIGTKYLAPDVEIKDLWIGASGKLLIVFSGDDYSTVRGLNVHGNLVNYGCLGFDRLGSFSSNHDDAVAGGYGRLFVSVGGNIENHGVINVNSLSMCGTNQMIASDKPIQATEFSPKHAKGTIDALTDLTFYNTNFTFWAGAVEETEFKALNMNGLTLTLTADAPSEPDIWWYMPAWHGSMTDMNIDFGNNGKLVINDCFVESNTFSGNTIHLGSESHGFLLGSNVFKGNVSIDYGRLHVSCTSNVTGFEVQGNLTNHASLNSAEIVYRKKGVEGTDYHMMNIGDKGRTHSGDVIVFGSFENNGSFGLGYQYDPDQQDRTKLHICTLGNNTTIKGDITAEVYINQVSPIDDYHNIYNIYDGKPLNKRGSVSVKDYLKLNRFNTEVKTTFIVPDGADCDNNCLPCTDPFRVYNQDIADERGTWNGKIINNGKLKCRYTECDRSNNMIASQKIAFPEWSRWSFNGVEDYWQVDQYVAYMEISEFGNFRADDFISRCWNLKTRGNLAYSSCRHDITLFYDDADLHGLNENTLEVYQSVDNGATWRRVSNDTNTFREPENNKVQLGRWDTPMADAVEGFWLFTLGKPNASGISELTADTTAKSSRTYDIMGREVNDSYKGMKIKDGKKYIQVR